MTHLFILVSYAVVSAAAGLVLSRSLVPLAPMMGYLIAGAGFLAAALVHEVFSRRSEQRDLLGQLDVAFDEIDDMREATHDLKESLARAREEMMVLSAAVETAAEGTNEALVREMKVLRSQLGHMKKVDRPKGARPGREKPSNRSQTAPPASEMTSAELNINREEILGHIREALETNRVDLYLQPIVSLPQRRTRHYEAFSRIRTSDGRIVAAQQYLDVAKQEGLIGTIDNLLLMRCVQLLRRNEKRQNDISFFVNISQHTLNDEDFLAQFIDFMASNPNLAARLVFEIAQQDVAALSEVALAQLSRLGELGFRFSMDQIDTLEIDFEGLARAHFRFVKIPINLLVTLPVDGADWVHPRSLKAKSAVSEISLVVERIEQESDVIEMLEYGFDYGQGFLFGAPRPSREEARAA
jgi:cyclic-di-GMP phosphodiesterase TipF (flagellum assembly factor)